MLPAATRMRRRADFTATMRGGRRAAAPALVVHLARTEGAGTPLAGFVVSRAVGNAVTRNRVRRQLRHLLRDRLDDLAPGTRLVIRATPRAANVGSGQLAGQLDRSLRTLGVAR